MTLTTIFLRHLHRFIANSAHEKEQLGSNQIFLRAKLRLDVANQTQQNS